ncbi:MAG TPA: hypothetical protein VKU44_06760 [Terriglobia bacterium]|nr:hypothetical protein [Terriglobia bacterium]
MDTGKRRRPLTWEDWRGIGHRRKWLFLLTALAVAAGTCIVSALIPGLYRSEALILCESRQAPPNDGQPPSDADLEQQLSTRIEETQSRSRLERLYQEYEAPELGRRSDQGIGDDVVDEFRGRIEIQIVKDNDPRRQASPYVLRVAFEDPRPTAAREVTNELCTLLVSEKPESPGPAPEDATPAAGKPAPEELPSPSAGLRIQDFASLPDSPDWPRWKINLGGLAAALLVALALATGLELRDSSVKCERDAEFYFGLRNLAVIPELLTAGEMGRARRKRLSRAVSAALAAVVVGAVLYYLYFLRW